MERNIIFEPCVSLHKRYIFRPTCIYISALTVPTSPLHGKETHSLLYNFQAILCHSTLYKSLTSLQHSKLLLLSFFLWRGFISPFVVAPISDGRLNHPTHSKILRNRFAYSVGKFSSRWSPFYSFAYSLCFVCFIIHSLTCSIDDFAFGDGPGAKMYLLEVVFNFSTLF